MVRSADPAAGDKGDGDPAAPKVLVVDDEPSMQEFLSILLGKEGYVTVCSGRGREAVARLAGQEFDAVLTDLNLPDLDGLEVLRQARELQPETPVVMITAYATTRTAIEALKLGAYDYVMKPFNVEELRNIVAHAVERKRLFSENVRLRHRLRDGARLGGMIGSSEPMQRLYSMIRRVAPTSSSVLITGESGTGKELAARAIHQYSRRAERPFVSINCAALPEDLLESELFGHVKGAFTGAVVTKKGLFETAHSGTLLLDEIGEMSPGMQAKLLRALQERSIRRIGGLDEIRVDVRLIATTNRDLPAMIAGGSFREDLFYRINVIHLHLPPLRERAEDIPLLAEHLVSSLAREMGKPITGLSREALRMLEEHSWPGNVRELENVLERGVALEGGEKIMPENLPVFASGVPASAEEVLLPLGVIPAGGFAMEERVREFEKGCLRQALRQSGGNMTQAAALLGMTFRSFRYYVKKYGLKEEAGEGGENGAPGQGGA